MNHDLLADEDRVALAASLLQESEDERRAVQAAHFQEQLRVEAELASVTGQTAAAKERRRVLRETGDARLALLDQEHDRLAAHGERLRRLVPRPDTDG